MKISLLTASSLLGIATLGFAERLDNRTGELISDLFQLAFPDEPEKNYKLPENLDLERAATVCQLIAAEEYNEDPKCSAMAVRGTVTFNNDISTQDMHLILCFCSLRQRNIPFCIRESDEFDLFYVLKTMPDSESLAVESLYDLSNRRLYYSRVPNTWGIEFY